MFFSLKKFFTLLVILLISVSVYPHSSFAEEKITSFDSEVIAKQDGTMAVTENIVYDFGTSQRHGIFRFIPLVSSVGDLYRVIDIDFTSVKRDGKDEEYTTDYSRDQVEVRIGNPNKTISGEHIYTISYVVKNGIGSNYEDHDEIYWNVTGSSWDVPISTASATIATDFGVTVGKTICFTGISGAREQDCTVIPQGDGKLIATNAILSAGEGLSIVASFPVNTFPESTLQKGKPVDPDMRVFLLVVVSLLVVLNFILAPLLVLWYFKKKHKKRLGKPVVTFDLPKDSKGNRITPAEAGTIDSAKLDKDDITATIFDLAIRKYLKIEEVEKKSVVPFGNKNDFKLIKLKDFSDLNEFEKTLMEAFFAGQKEVLLSEAVLSYTEFKNLEKANFKSLISKGLYTKNPQTQMGALLVFGIISLVTLNMVLGPVLIFLSRMLNGRTQAGDLLDFKIDGLKIFLKATNRYNAWQAKNILTIEKMIPYAMSLGYIDQFMKQISILKPDYQPSWYSGTRPFYGAYAGFSTSMSSGITTSAPSSSSGFSGGSSGGGGGGGGGGSW